MQPHCCIPVVRAFYLLDLQGHACNQDHSGVACGSAAAAIPPHK
jgi:hypothetical protein